jgi:uncharacterized protein YceK
MTRVWLAATVIALMAGCGTLQSSYSGHSDVDVKYVAAVERAAWRTGAHVIWLNFPRRPPTVQ